MVIVGHRGAALEAPENTLGGFQHAWTAGVRAFELDVHLSGDKKCVVIHDDTVDRTTNGQGRVCEFTVAELARLNASTNFAGWSAQESVPTLRSVLDYLHEAELILVEIKDHRPGVYPIICDELRQLTEAFSLQDRVVAASFVPQFVQCASRILPQQPRGLFVKNDWDASNLKACQWWMPQFGTVDLARIRTIQRQGKRVACWTPNTPEDLLQTIAYHPDAVITDAPSLALRLALSGPSSVVE